MEQPENRPALVDQPMPPFGTWRPSEDHRMIWHPTENATPRGPLDNQVHDRGFWRPTSSEQMVWVDTDPQPSPQP